MIVHFSKQQTSGSLNAATRTTRRFENYTKLRERGEVEKFLCVLTSFEFIFSCLLSQPLFFLLLVPTMFPLNCWNEQSSTSKLVEVCGRRGKMRDNKFQVPSSPISTDKCSSSCLVFIRAREHCSYTLSRRRLGSISLAHKPTKHFSAPLSAHFFFANFLWVFQFSLVQALLHTICIIMKIPFQYFSAFQHISSD